MTRAIITIRPSFHLPALSRLNPKHQEYHVIKPGHPGQATTSVRHVPPDRPPAATPSRYQAFLQVHIESKTPSPRASPIRAIQTSHPATLGRGPRKATGEDRIAQIPPEGQPCRQLPRTQQTPRRLSPAAGNSTLHHTK